MGLIDGGDEEGAKPHDQRTALQGAKNNGAFFREVLNDRLTAESPEGEGMRVIVVVTSSRLFESGSDLRHSRSKAIATAASITFVSVST